MNYKMYFFALARLIFALFRFYKIIEADLRGYKRGFTQCEYQRVPSARDREMNFVIQTNLLKIKF